MVICFDMPNVFAPGADRVANSRTLKVLLDSLIEINHIYLVTEASRGRSVPSLYRSGVRYGRTEIWDSIPALYKRKKGDCKSLTAAYIAEKRFRGIRCLPVHRFKPQPDGSTLYHILVQLPNGEYTDPSKVLGMGKNENARF